MKSVYYGPQYGITPASGVECSAKLQAFLNSAKENAQLILAPGDYYLENRITLEELRNVSISGYGARLIAHFDQTDPYTFQACFGVNNCENLSLEGLCLTTDNPANTAGRVLSIDREKLEMDILLDDGFVLTGNERIFSVDSFDEGAAGPNWHVLFADDGGRKGKGYRYKRISDRVIRMFCWPSTGVQILDLTPGERLCMRHSLYPTNQMTFRNCSNVLLQDITVESSPGESCAIYPRCRDFTFKRFAIRLPAGSKRIYASNADGIHITGLGGKLRIEDCIFENLGDDALNVHTTGGVVTGVEANVIHCTLGDRLGSVGLPLDADWACSGDEIGIYQGDTFVKKGSVRVAEYEVGRIRFTDATCDILPGDMIANMAFCPDTVVRNSRIHGTRARGILFQTNKVLLEDCTFSDISHQAIQITSDMTRWSEMCPCEEVVIRNNVFHHNGLSCKDIRSAGIAVGIGHGGGCYDYTQANGVHGNITITGNRFYEMKDAAIFADRVCSMTITDNAFARCCTRTEGRAADYCGAMVLFNCEQVQLEENQYMEESDSHIIRR